MSTDTTEAADATAASFFSTAPAPTEIYTLSLHDALPISIGRAILTSDRAVASEAGHATIARATPRPVSKRTRRRDRSEEHTSELQSRQYLVCRLLLEKKNDKIDLHSNRFSHVAFPLLRAG